MKRLVLLGLAALALAVACGDTAETGEASSSSTVGSSVGAGGGGGGGTTSGAGGSACSPIDGDVVTMTTSDGVELSADLYVSGVSGGAGAVLLHMIPPSNDRSNYPPAFIDKLVAAGIDVINVDRRGAGSSGGNAMDAYVGPNGKLDALAAFERLTSSPCGPDATRIAIVGASNGTTTALDYAIFANGDAGAHSPKALVFLTGGTYTENQNAMDQNRAVVDALPILFVFSTAEAAWSAQFETGAPSAWQFSEYDPGDHGTRMFTSRPESMDDVASFLADAL
jgi:pimeloyl-ACP methyl ester carboxylesterase